MFKSMKARKGSKNGPSDPTRELSFPRDSPPPVPRKTSLPQVHNDSFYSTTSEDLYSSVASAPAVYPSHSRPIFFETPVKPRPQPIAFEIDVYQSTPPHSRPSLTTRQRSAPSLQPYSAPLPRSFSSDEPGQRSSASPQRRGPDTADHPLVPSNYPSIYSSPHKSTAVRPTLQTDATLISSTKMARRSRQLSLETVPSPRALSGNNRLSRKLSLESTNLKDAYAAANSKAELSKAQQRFDAITTSANTAVSSLNSFFATNSSIISTASINLASADTSMQQISSAMNSFTNTANVMMKGLDALAHVHPAVGVTVQAFKLVVQLDLQRRENNKKVGLVKLQLQDTVAVLFQLRTLKDPEEIGPDGQTMGGRIQHLMETMAKDIKKIGNGCDAYLAKGLLAKTVKAQKYEGRLSSFVTLMANHKKNLEFAISAHTAVGVDAANEKLDSQTSQLKKMEENMELMFKKLETARERELSSFMEEKGGAARCVSNNTLLEALVAKSGETMASLSGGRGNSKEEEMANVRKFLQKELAESIDEAFNRNMAQFEGKLQLAEKRMTDHVTSESDRVIRVLQDGAHSRIMDQDIQDIWKDMGWKGSSVKARHFVVALHDFFNEKMAKQLKSATEDGHQDVNSLDKSQRRDRWALTYINVAHVQPILESVDDDCTGWITIKEVNSFVSDRPPAWSLPYWLAFWAVGWHASVTRYRNKIYSLIQKMFGLLDHVLPPNKQAVNEYLMNHSIWRLELLLRSTTPASSSLASDVELTAMTATYTKMEEERLEKNLEPLLYIIESPATVSLICGPGRIERYIYPLIYVLLRRHFQLLLLSCEHVLDEDELDSASGSLLNIVSVIDDRIENLEVIFKQTDADIVARFANYAFGMFKLSRGNIQRNPHENSFSTWTEFGAFTDGEATNSLQPSDIPFTILKHGIKDDVGFKAFQPASVLPRSRVHHAINGVWTGHLYRWVDNDYISTQGLVQIAIGLTDKGRIEGGGETYSGLLTCAGDARPEGRKGHTLEVTFELIYPDGFKTKCIGRYSPHDESISGEWEVEEDAVRGPSLDPSEDSGGDDLVLSRQPSRLDFFSDAGSSVLDFTMLSPSTLQTFRFTRTPPWLQRFRPPKLEFDYNPPRARWIFACAAVLHEVKRSRWWWDFFRTRFAERRKVVDLTTRSKIWLKGFTIGLEDALNNSDRAELAQLRQTLSPGDTRFYSILADIEIQKLPWHIGYKCDACEREIVKSRNVCTSCINETFSDQVDLCIACSNSKVSVRGFTHEPSHSLLRTEQVLHDHLLAKTIRDARAITERTKEYFRTLERQARSSEGLKQAGTHEAFQKGPAESQRVCACCGQFVTPLLWVCVVCTPDAFICATCESQGLDPSPDIAPGHSRTHPLVCVRDTTPVVQTTMSTDARIIGLEKKLATLETNFEARITAMEGRVEQRLAGVENALKQIIATLAGSGARRTDTARR